ncbi:MAG: isocitrate lyase/phosphoenolpyruvate mutase family protein, partial [Pseudomonadota bacterium]
DGNALPVDVHVRAVEAIARVTNVPVSVDSEGGYSDDPAQVASTIGRLIGAGAVGINLEDGTGAPELHAAKIEAVKAEAARRGVDLFVNARIDTVLRKLVPAKEAPAETLRRARLYADAGADGIFVPALTDAAMIGDIAAAIDPLPLNVLVWPGLPPAEELRRLGVRRLSAGGWIGRDALAHAWRSAADFLNTGNFSDLLSRASGDMPDLNDLFGEET